MEIVYLPLTGDWARIDGKIVELEQPLDDVEIHTPGPTCPRSPCYGREDRCPNLRWADCWIIKE